MDIKAELDSACSMEEVGKIIAKQLYDIDITLKVISTVQVHLVEQVQMVSKHLAGIAVSTQRIGV